MDDTTFEIYEIIVTVFLMIDQADRVRFFKKIFLVANIILDIVFKIFFFTLRDVNINF